ncbi:calcium/sodium antiporter [Aliifodinibius sp. S!AR15-10]|uniref:calcium/sodium antiporter n=1 Tax=Aliifodinibius sp. S!AR15-10 TaxID=2950437 RepID=UPI002857F510|nr:calcium/sodium antiporter [Aliifodinibius sp. S!AR15-10]MDR8392600.1 calcium/sodium antiporter [Aliifodinibius sp. S!AR15-10]
MTVFLFVSGLALLIIGAEALVRGATKIASGLGISPLIIGLTIVAFGTSSPELAVSIKAGVSGQADIAVGNVVGSNIFNVLFILGLSALIVPLYVSQQLIKLDVPLMIGLSLVTLLIALDQHISRIDGLLLVTGLIVYILVLVYMGIRNVNDTDKPDKNTITENNSTRIGNWPLNVILVVGGLTLLVIGSRWFVNSAVTIANYFGISEVIIGLTIVAAGTSMPEVVTSIVAAIRNERDIAVGNVVGSNIFNIMGVLGISSIVAPAGIDVTEAIIGFDIPIMTAVAVACLPIFFSGGKISRWEGGLFLGYYVAYTLYLVLDATGHDSLPLFNDIMFYFVIPLTVITIIIIAIRELRPEDKS